MLGIGKEQEGRMRLEGIYRAAVAASGDIWVLGAVSPPGKPHAIAAGLTATIVVSEDGFTAAKHTTPCTLMMPNPVVLFPITSAKRLTDSVTSHLSFRIMSRVAIVLTRAVVLRWWPARLIWWQRLALRITAYPTTPAQGQQGSYPLAQLPCLVITHVEH
jgi:hypothetical protein